MASLQHHPYGYPALGLVAKTLPLRYRQDANLSRLARRLERWEAARGNVGFTARNLTKLPTALAFEMVHVYVALRERYPKVQPDYVDFCTDVGGGKTLGLSTIYPSLFPTLRQAAEYYESDDADALVEAAIEDEYFQPYSRDVRAEARYLDGVRNVARSGVIEMGNIFSTKKGYLGLRRFWEDRNARAIRMGRAPRMPELRVSEATFVFVHEFGHLVEGEISESGWQGVADVYGALSETILGTHKPSVQQWRWHLVNYPAFAAPVDSSGPQQGGKVRQDQTRKALRDMIASKLGSYAPVARDEVFAEAFALSVCGTPKLRRELSGMREALERAGIRRRNVQPPRR